MKKTIYVAGASAQIELNEKFRDKLREAGWIITFDWAAKVREVGNASPDDPEIRREAALADLKGVADADVLWLLQPDPTSTSTGAWVELGAAISRRDIYRRIWIGWNGLGGIGWDGTLKDALKDVVIVASGLSKKCIFSDLVDYRFQSHDDAFDYIVNDLGRTAG
jgi:hypothetical protein